MSTSKENYDHLVFQDGNYGIDIAKGIYPGSGQAPGIKGDKGDTGYAEKGQKGAKGTPGVNGAQGANGGQGAKGDPGLEGQKGLQGDKGQKGAEGPAGQKGQDGSYGDKGQKGAPAEAPVFVFRGDVPSFNDLPMVGNQVGDVYQTTDNDFLYAWDGTGWVTIAEAIGVVKGEKGDKGTKGQTPTDGAKGDQGQKGQKGIGGGQGPKGNKGVEAEKGQKGEKGLKGEVGQNGTNGTDGTKGDKGQKGEDVDYNLVYTKVQTDSLIEDFRPPQFAFDIDAYSLVGNPPTNPNKIIGGSVDFASTDQNATIYNSGIVTINSAVTVDNSPIAAADLMIVNYVAAGGPANAGDVRDVDYKLLQYVFALNEGDGAELGYWRFVEPGGGKFGEWNLSQFDSANYYTKAQVDALDREYTISSTQGADAAKTKLVLTDDNGTTTDVNINVSGGLSATSTDSNTITIDASAISGNVTFEGGITAADPGATPPIVAQDPATLDPTPNGGDYFIFTNAGTAWNGEAVTEGDWAIYNASDTVWIVLDYQTSTIGVASVDVEGGLLTKTGTAADPIIGLTKATLEAEVLGDYVTSQQLGSSITGLQIEDLADVDAIGGTTWTPGGLAFAQYDNQIANNTQPAGNGQYSVIPELNTIWMMQNSVNNPGSLYINTMLSTATAGDKFIIKATDGSWQQIVTFVSYSQIAGTRKLVIEEASGVAAVNGYTGTWAIRGQVLSLNIANGSVLRYNTTSSKWELSTSYTTSQADTEFLSKTQGGTVDQKVSIRRNQQSVASNSFVLQGRTASNGSSTAALLKTYIQPTSNTSKDWVQYFGETDTSDTQIQTRGSVNTKLLDYMLLDANNIVTGQQTFKYPSSGGTGDRVMTVADVAGNDCVVMNKTGAIAWGQIVNHGNTTLNNSSACKYQVAKKLTNTYIDIFTTGTTAESFLNGPTFGTVRIGRPSGSDNLFQVFTPSGNGGAIQSLVVTDNGQVQANNQGPTIDSTNVVDASLITKRQLVTAIADSATSVVPVGSIIATLASSGYAGYFLCNGASFNINTYPELHAILQTTAGYVSGKLPDFTGQHLVGKGGSFNSTIGTKIGSRTKLPVTPFGTSNPGNHVHKYGSNARYGGGTTKSSYDADPRTDNSFSTTGAGSHTHTITGGDVVTNPPTVVISWIIKHD